MIILITKSLLASGVVDSTAVRAVLCIYLLLALLFAALHQCLGVFFDPYLSGASNPPTASQALYFSVVTLATIGYGDIVPVNRHRPGAGRGRGLARPALPGLDRGGGRWPVSLERFV